jgi:hypothetical protein
LLDRLYVTKTDVLDVVQRLVQEVGNVRVMERVDDTAAAPLADDEPQVSDYQWRRLSSGAVGSHE